MKTQHTAEPGSTSTGTVRQHIVPFLWFDDQAEEAADFYLRVFKNSGRKSVTLYGAEGAAPSGKTEGSVMTVDFLLEGQEFTVINGGPMYKINPSISFFVNCETPQEVDSLWKELSPGGQVMMEIDKYPFSERYGWIQDKFGVSWQLIVPARKQKITPCLMFTGKVHKKAEEAINFYVSIFKNSSILQLERYTAGQGPEGAVVHAKFTLNGQEFTAMDSHMDIPIPFNPAISMVVRCKTQEEVDHYWEKLSSGGDENQQQCGWLADKYGVSWQIVPDIFLELMNDPDPKKSSRVMQALLQMKKIDIETLKRAYNNL